MPSRIAQEKRREKLKAVRLERGEKETAAAGVSRAKFDADQAKKKAAKSEEAKKKSSSGTATTCGKRVHKMGSE